MSQDDKKRSPAKKGRRPSGRDLEEITALPPEKALDEILSSPDTNALVRSLAEEDFYFLVNEIGPEDSLPLLSAAAPRQWEYVLDLETWRRDRFDVDGAVRWLQLMEQAAGPRLVRWLLDRKKDLMELFLHRTVEVRIREHDQDPSDFGDDFFTFDDVYYIRVPPPGGDPETADLRHEKRQELARRLLERIADADHFTYQQELFNTAGLLPAEAEEEAYRLRNVRLAERGFATPEEAVGIYQRLTPEAFFQRGRKRLVREAQDESGLPVPRFAEGLLGRQVFFTRALSTVESSAVLLQLQQEFAGLCNRVIAADRVQVQEREALRGVVEKAAGYLSLGLERLTQGKRGEPAALAARIIEAYPLVDLFRVGHGLALSLKWKARRWQQQSWFEATAGLPISFWDEAWVGVLGGLLLPRPRFFDNYRTGAEMYRDFACLDDIRETGEVLDRVIDTDRLLSGIRIDPAGRRPQGLTYKNFLLTLWASDELESGDPEGPAPLVPAISLDDVKRFHRRLFPGMSDADGGLRRIADVQKEEFVRWLSRRTGLDAADIADRLGQTLEALFAELEEEMGAVAAEDLDPRYMRLFLVAGRDSASDDHDQEAGD